MMFAYQKTNHFNNLKDLNPKKESIFISGQRQNISVLVYHIQLIITMIVYEGILNTYVYVASTTFQNMYYIITPQLIKIALIIEPFYMY